MTPRVLVVWWLVHAWSSLSHGWLLIGCSRSHRHSSSRVLGSSLWRPLSALGTAHILLPLVVGVLSDPNLFDLKGWLRLWEYLLQFGMRIVDSVLDVMNLWLR